MKFAKIDSPARSGGFAGLEAAAREHVFFVQCSLLEFLEDHLKYEAADVLLMRSSISAVDSFKRITNCPI